MKSIFTKEQIDFMKENYDKISYGEIANILGFSERQIRGKINNMGLSKLRKINDTYFDSIDTPIKSYLLGFIFADGWISYNENDRRYEFGIELQSQDRYIIEKINEVLGNKNKIYHKSPKDKIINGIKTRSHDMDGIRIYSKHLVYSLESHGISKNKSYSDNFPRVNENLFFDFLRGYIDGDGCYYTKNNIVTIHITSGSSEPLSYIKEKLLTYGIESSVYKEKDHKYRIYINGKNNIKTLLNLLYYKEDLFYLKRKYNKIQHLITGLAA